MDRQILHVDLNNFYASVECMLNPSLAGKAVAVGGSVESRKGIILAKNMKAKGYGVATAEPIWQAKQKCPDLVIVPPQFEEYLKYSKLVRGICVRYTDLLEPFGIDECWLDVTGSQRLFGSGAQIAEQIRQAVKSELGLTVSVGVSFNKIFAKLGSDMKKPDAVTVIPKDSFREKIWQLPVSDLIGVGKATQRALDKYQIKTIGDLANANPVLLAGNLKSHAYRLHDYANGLDDSPVLHKDFVTPAKSVGHGATTPKDLEHPEEVRLLMADLCQRIGRKLRTYEKKAGGIAISIKDNDFRTKQWQKQLTIPSQSASFLAKEAFTLFAQSYLWEKPIRAVTITAINLCEENAPCQLDLFNEAAIEYQLSEADALIDDMQQKFGNNSVQSACLYSDNTTSSSEGYSEDYVF